MKSTSPVSVLFLLWSLAACAASPQPPGGDPATASGAKGGGNAVQDGRKEGSEADQKAEERKQKEKQLREKRRDLEYAKLEVQTTAIERQVRTMAVETAVANAQLELDKKQQALALFLKEIKPRELEEQRIDLDAQTNRADEAKDELAELEGMYKEDEFASSTKELVLKRGRRQMELAARRLAVARKEFELFEQHTLADRERDLRHDQKEAEQGLEKARLEHQKAQIELGLQQRKADDRVGDLQTEIAELERELGGADK